MFVNKSLKEHRIDCPLGSDLNYDVISDILMKILTNATIAITITTNSKTIKIIFE